MLHYPHLGRILFFIPFVLALGSMSSTLGQGLPLTELRSPNEQESGYFGIAVAGVEDLDGDGRGDVLVGAYLEESGAGRAYVLSGSTGAVLQELESPNGEVSGRFGISVSGVPDVDGDGRSDLLVGDESADGAGRAYLFSGTTGVLLQTLSSPNPEQYGDFGFSVSGVPDADGDGRGDLLIGSFENRAYLFSGATGALLQTLTNPDPLFGGFGLSGSGVADVDGDGRGDLIVEGGGPSDERRVYLFSGASGSLILTLQSPDDRPGGLFGRAVSSVPDIDGDGRSDILAGDPNAYQDGDPIFAGRAYAFSSATGALLHEFQSPNQQSSGNFGNSVSGVADVDGDGRGDVLVGAVAEDFANQTYSEGRAYIFSGASGALLRQIDSPSNVSGNLGFSVAGVPDVDGDGRGDVIVGAPAEGPPSFSGRAYVFSGGSGFSVVASGRPATITAGEAVSVRVTITNANTQSATLDLWTVVNRGFGPGLTRRVGNITLAAGASVTRRFNVIIPISARAGFYTLKANVGTFPANVLASDSFDFNVVDP